MTIKVSGQTKFEKIVANEFFFDFVGQISCPDNLVWGCRLSFQIDFSPILKCPSNNVAIWAKLQRSPSLPPTALEFNLGAYLREGRPGVAKDHARARHFFTLAAAQGDTEAQRIIPKLDKAMQAEVTRASLERGNQLIILTQS